MQRDHLFSDYRGRRVTVMGLGSFGGGVGAVRFLVEQGAVVTVTDQRTEDQLGEAITELRSSPPAHWHLGRHDENHFTGAELVVANPAIRRDHPLLLRAVAAGVPLTSEMNLFWQRQPGTVLAVTGSNGKSTTTALLHAMLQPAAGEELIAESGKPSSAGLSLSALNFPPSIWLGGNIGRSLLPDVERIQPGEFVVLELSSFQLTDLDRLQASPHIAVVTNFSPNHLDWHSTVDHYRWAKQTLLRWQSAADVAVLNTDDPDVSTWPTNGRRLLFGLADHGGEGTFLRGKQAVWRFQGHEKSFPLRDWLKLPGRHNLANALAASAAALAAGATFEQVRQGLETYEPLPHRLQFVGKVKGRRFYNDSLATTPESAIVALDAFTEPVILLAGGYDKHVDLSEMAGCIARRAKAVALMGQTADTLRELIRRQSPTAAITSEPLVDFEVSFRWAWEHSAPGDVILLSPGCASYDWFRNFADRGERFTRLVGDLASESR